MQEFRNPFIAGIFVTAELNVFSVQVFIRFCELIRPRFIRQHDEEVFVYLFRFGAFEKHSAFHRGFGQLPHVRDRRDIRTDRIEDKKLVDILLHERHFVRAVDVRRDGCRNVVYEISRIDHLHFHHRAVLRQYDICAVDLSADFRLQFRIDFAVFDIRRFDVDAV